MEVLVFANVCWDNVGDDGGTVCTLQSEWVAEADPDNSSIVEVAAGVRELEVARGQARR